MQIVGTLTSPTLSIGILIGIQTDITTNFSSLLYVNVLIIDDAVGGMQYK